MKYTTIKTISGKTKYLVGIILEETNEIIKLQTAPHDFIVILSKINIENIDRG